MPEEYPNHRPPIALHDLSGLAMLDL